MDTMFETLFSWQTALLCIGIWVVTYSLRTLVEGYVKIWYVPSKVQAFQTSVIWREVILPLAPILNALLFAVLFKDSFPWPEMLSSFPGAKILYAIVCGYSSGFVYTRFRSLLKTKLSKTPRGQLN